MFLLWLNFFHCQITGAVASKALIALKSGDTVRLYRRCAGFAATVQQSEVTTCSHKHRLPTMFLSCHIMDHRNAACLKRVCFHRKCRQLASESVLNFQMLSVDFHPCSDPLNVSVALWVIKSILYLLHFDVIVPKDLLSPKHFGPAREEKA